MGFRKFLVVFLFATFSTKALPVYDNAVEQNSNKTEDINYRLPNDTAPLHYDIKFIPYISEDNFTFDGEATIEFKVVTPTSDLSLHSWNLTYDESATRLISPTGDVLTPERYNYNDISQILRLYFEKILEHGKYTLKMKYTGILTDDQYGFYRSYYETKEGDKVWMVSTQFQAVAARRAFPCWDEPALKATFDVSIKHYPNYTALSNMPVKQRSEIDERDSKVWTRFRTTPVMSTYLVAFIVADYGNITNAEHTVNVWGRPEMLSVAEFVHEVAEKVSAELERYTNSTVRVPKMDHVAVPQHSFGPMENWGLITYPEYAFRYNEKEDTIDKKLTVITAAAHELTHQWFGNVVSPSWWSHIWLNEGFATYFESYIIDKILDGARAKDIFMVKNVQLSLYRDATTGMRPIDMSVNTPDEIDAAFSMSTYIKAAAILRMLSYVITQDVFRAGILKYLNAHEYDSANPDCLWTAMQSALDESEVPHGDFNVKEVMDTWIMQRSHPLVTVDRDYVTGDARIAQQDYANLLNSFEKEPSGDDETEDEKNTSNGVWWIPINYATKTNPDFSDTHVTGWLTPSKNFTVSNINPEDWIIVNKQEMGYFRVNYDQQNWEKIAMYLNTDDFTKIHVLNRAQIIDDIIHLTLSEQTNTTTFFKIVNYLSRETDYIPWFPIFQFLFKVENYLIHPEAQVTLKPWILNLMENLTMDVGFVERPDDDIVTKMKRNDVLTWACRLGQPKCREKATTALLQFLHDPEAQSIPPNLGRWTFCMGLLGVNETVWDEIVVPFMKSPMAVIRSLECVGNQAIIEKYLNLSISDDPKNEKYDTLRIVGEALSIPENFNTILDFLVRHWNRFSTSAKQARRLIRYITYYAITEEQAEKLKALIATSNLDKDESTKIWQEYQTQFSETSVVLEKWIRGIS